MFITDEIIKLTVKYFWNTSGVAYSKHIVHLYAYHGGDDLQDKLEVCPWFESINNHI